MLRHLKSVVAVALAVLAALAAGAWARNRARTLERLEEERGSLQSQLAEAGMYAAVMVDLRLKRTAVREEMETWTARSAEKGREGPQLVQTAVNAASSAGLRITAAAEASSPANSARPPAAGAAIRVVSYRFSLKGPYSGLVRFLQILAPLPAGQAPATPHVAIASLDVAPCAEGSDATNEVSADVVLSVFSESGRGTP